MLAASEIQRLKDELELTEAPFEFAHVTSEQDPAAYVKNIRAIVKGHLRQAEEALVPVSRKAAFRAWYTGSAVEQAWLSIHRAGEALLMIQSPGSLIREFLEIDGAFGASIAAADPRYANLALLLKESNRVLLSNQPPDRFSAIMRSKLKAVRNAANIASDTTRETVRRWRNLLVLGGGVLGGLAIIVCVVHMLVPNFISRRSSGISSAAASSASHSIPTVVQHVPSPRSRGEIEGPGAGVQAAEQRVERGGVIVGPPRMQATTSAGALPRSVPGGPPSPR